MLDNNIIVVTINDFKIYEYNVYIFLQWSNIKLKKIKWIILIIIKIVMSLTIVTIKKSA